MLHHLESPTLGLAGAPLREAGIDVLEVDRHGTTDLPAVDEVDGILTLGGEQSVLDGDPSLAEEAGFLRQGVAAGVPVLGICLGAQVLAHGLGGEVRRVGRSIEWRELRRRPEAGDDPLATALPDPHAALHWNEDAFTLPDGAIELFDRPAAQVEAFRAGSCAWGFQFHPDVDAACLEDWYRLPGYLEEAGLDEAVVREEDTRRMPHHTDASTRLFAAWAAVVRSRVPA